MAKVRTPRPSQNLAPTLCDESIHENDRYHLKKIWEWDVDYIAEDGPTHLLRVRLSGDSFFGSNGLCTTITQAGSRPDPSLYFSYLGKFSDNRAKIRMPETGKFGFIDQNQQVWIAAKYDDATDFKDGVSIAKRGDDTFLVDADGREMKLADANGNCPYLALGRFSDGLCAVSKRPLDPVALQTGGFNRGLWGYIDTTGKETIAAKYCIALPFDNGFAIVASPEPHPDEGTAYRFGVINCSGEEVIPCQHALIDFALNLGNATEQQRHGMWPVAITGDGDSLLWGIKDEANQWIAPPVFQSNLFLLFNDNLIFRHDTACDSEQYGLFDLKSQQVVIEPERYVSLSFDIQGNILAVDGNGTTHLLDAKTYQEVFQTGYAIYYPDGFVSERCYFVWTGEPETGGIIDRQGNVLIPPAAGHIWMDDDRLLFKENGKVGIKDFSGKILFPPVYDAISAFGKAGSPPFYLVGNRTKDGWERGLVTKDGRVIVPLLYDNIYPMSGGNRFILRRDRHHEMVVFTRKTLSATSI